MIMITCNQCMYYNEELYLSLHDTGTVGLGSLLVGSLALEQIKAILVCLQLGDGNLARVDANRDGLAYK